MKPALTLLLLLALCTSSNAATTRAVACDGCSATQMAALATDTVNQGTVYVLDAVNAVVAKYTVITETVDTIPYSIWKQAMPQFVEPDLASAWRAYVASREGVEGQPGSYQLPPDFPIHSVAGALYDPEYTNTSIEDYLLSLNLFEQMNMDIGTLVIQVLRSNIPFVDLKDLLKTIKITVTFPDGTSQDYAVSVSIDAVTAQARTEVEPVGNARMPDGRPAPTSRLGFNGVTVYDRNGSLREWVLWAQQLGLFVSGGKSGVYMRCEIDGDEIRCTVVKTS